eukprot:CAMPEP_0172616172 /NCGR_PEP_ID=MMETSP1068-20121228/62751_1 /TAXON_ID=35684 /ORGANISM="Pseudopedinella elastica, Strain CCMP716" /LENGTH=259 /DNA_ID=CAMNT_0013421511 /DNA_START=41 /DNA_END=820 /DNA_ORIENTATION=-
MALEREEAEGSIKGLGMIVKLKAKAKTAGLNVKSIRAHKRSALGSDDFHAAIRGNTTTSCGELVAHVQEVLRFPDIYPGNGLLSLGLYGIFLLGSDDVNREALGRAGACKCVAEALRTRGIDKSAKVAAHGCAAAANLAFRNPYNQTQLAFWGAPARVLDTMRARPKDHTVTAHGCTALRNLAMGHQENAAALRGLGAKQVLMAATWNFTGDFQVQHWAKAALALVPKPEATLLGLIASELKSELQESEEEEEGTSTKE